MLAAGLLLASSASIAPAHGGDDAEEDYILVQQALGHLAQNPGPESVSAAEAKIDEALTGPDQDGVDVAAVRRAQTALLDGRTDAAQQTLQLSIAEATAGLGPATGEQTGTTVVGQPLSGRGSLAGTDWALGGLSVLLLVAGTGLAAAPRSPRRHQRPPAAGPRSAAAAPPRRRAAAGG